MAMKGAFVGPGEGGAGGRNHLAGHDPLAPRASRGGHLGPRCLTCEAAPIWTGRGDVACFSSGTFETGLLCSGRPGFGVGSGSRPAGFGISVGPCRSCALGVRQVCSQHGGGPFVPGPEAQATTPRVVFQPLRASLASGGALRLSLAVPAGRQIAVIQRLIRIKLPGPGGPAHRGSPFS